MRKFLCILAAALCLTAHASAQERHIQFGGVFTGALENRTVTADLFEKDGVTAFVSSLIPNTVIELEDPKTGSTLAADLEGVFSLRPEAVYTSLETAENILFAWTGKQQNETVSGAFAGELFDRASSETSCRFSLSAFAGYLQESLGTAGGTEGDGMNPFMNRLLYEAAESMKAQGTETDPVILFSSYDEGSWYTVRVTVGNDVLMTLSADRTYDGCRRVLAAYKENGLYCFRDTEYRLEGKQFSVTSAFRTGKEPSFRRAAEQKPLFTESFTLAGDTASSCTFECVFAAEKLKDPVIMIGKITSPETGRAGIDADAYIRGHEADTLRVTVNTDAQGSGEDFSGHQVIKTDRNKENAGIRLSAVSGLTLLAAEILPTLPEEYQKMIVNYFLK